MITENYLSPKDLKKKKSVSMYCQEGHFHSSLPLISYFGKGRKENEKNSNRHYHHKIKNDTMRKNLNESLCSNVFKKEIQLSYHIYISFI